MPKLTNAANAYIGFDTGSYPGDDAMQDWWANSPYQFVGYYLPAPCHTVDGFAPWIGNRQTLLNMGWTLLVVYVGQQRPGNNCGQNALTNAQGFIDANDAADTATQDGFLPGTFIFLDIEGGDAVEDDLEAYLSGWIPQLVARGFSPAIYCSRNLPVDIKNCLETLYDTIDPAPPPARFWLSGDNVPARFNRDTSAPSDATNSFPEATAWQALPADQTWGATTLNVDESVCLLADPSSPILLLNDVDLWSGYSLQAGDD